MPERNDDNTADNSDMVASDTSDEPTYSSDDFASENSEQYLDSAQATIAEGTTTQDIQNLNLAQLVSVLRREPSKTFDALWQVLNPNSLGTAIIEFDTNSGANAQQTSDDEDDEQLLVSRLRNIHIKPLYVRLGLYITAFVLALIGSIIWSETQRSAAYSAGLPYMVAAFFVWVSAGFFANAAGLRQWLQNKDVLGRISIALRAIPIILIVISIAIYWQSTSVDDELVVSYVAPATQLMLLGIATWLLLDLGKSIFGIAVNRMPERFPDWVVQAIHKRRTSTGNAQNINAVYLDSVPLYMKIPPFRFVLALAGMVSVIMVWLGTANNTFTTPAFYLWILSAILWSLALAPLDWNPLEMLKRWRDGLAKFDVGKHRYVILALILIMGVAFWFRFNQLDQIPREMTDDHVEKILDAGLVRDGARIIFFANNGGREPVQMYLIALASYLPGLGIDHFTIKVVAAIESLLTVLAVFWMVYELMIRETHRRRVWMALFASALLAGSYWHLAITRQALRIPLTALVASLLLIFLARAMRRNNRADFIIAGLILGYGLYMYQAVRMLPVVIVVGIGIAIYFIANTWRERLRYVVNLTVLVWISFVIFVPMYHYSQENSDLFWRRTLGRLAGDDVINQELPDGSAIPKRLTSSERIAALTASVPDNIPTLMSNIRNVTLMFNRKGDVGAISGIPNKPALDVYSGALLIIGLGAWGVLMVRRRDAVYWLIPIFVFIMLMPSALSIAFPVENPSHTRTSGAIPAIYMMLSLPLAIFAEEWFKLGERHSVMAVGLLAPCLVVLASYNSNAITYFDDYPTVYAVSFDPYTEPGQYLQGFALSSGTYGNAFMMGYPHWWSHRAIGLAAGLEERWSNGVVDRQNIPRDIHTASQRFDKFRFNPERDILFFYSPDDTETEAYLQELFPNGYARLQETYPPNDNDYMTFTVPALGNEGFQDWLDTYYFGASS